MPQQPSNYDQTTRQWHADPLWRRYDPDSQPMPRGVLESLRGLFRPKPQDIELVESPTPPPAPQLTQNPPYQPRVPNYLPIQDDPERTAPEQSDSAVNALQRYTPDPSEGNAIRTGLGANNPLELTALREQRQEELERSIAQGGEFGGPGRQQAYLGDLSQEMAADPYTGVAERGRVGAIQGLVEQAQLGGFDSPQAMAQYGRQQEERKIGMPAEQAKVGGAYDVQQQQEASRGALAVQESKGAQAENFMEMMNRARMSGADVSRMSIPGVGAVTMTPQQRLPHAITNRLTTAQMRFDRYGDAMGAVGELNAAKAAVLNEHPANPRVKALAQQIAADPNGVLQPFNVIRQKIQTMGNTDVSEQDFNDLNEILGYLRGRSF